MADSPEPSSRPVVAMVGAGQLARMTHQAAIDLDVELRVLANSPDEPAVMAGAKAVYGAPDDADALERVAKGAEVVTFDHELVPNRLVAGLAEAGHRVHPGALALEIAQDKLAARRRMAEAGLPVPAFRMVEGDAAAAAEAVGAFADEVGWPVVLKTPTGGYDGRGVGIVERPGDLRGVLEQMGTTRLLAEAFVEATSEVALVGARRPSGQWAAYPLVETRQRQGICRELLMPAPVPEAVAAEAGAVAERIARTFAVTGILAVELFVTPAGEIVVNEVAVRPHNSGHATIEGAVTSQFQNHLRAVLDWPLGDTGLRAPAVATVNVLGGPTGDPRDRLPAALEVGEAAVHLYGKAARPGRKLGHVTALGPDAETALDRARRAAAALGGA